MQMITQVNPQISNFLLIFLVFSVQIQNKKVNRIKNKLNCLILDKNSVLESKIKIFLTKRELLIPDSKICKK